ncbi:hypothetical protein PMAYCL1PPCAC_20765, partial [Pristionchus mayeri]
PSPLYSQCTPSSRMRDRSGRRISWRTAHSVETSPKYIHGNVLLHLRNEILSVIVHFAVGDEPNCRLGLASQTGCIDNLAHLSPLSQLHRVSIGGSARGVVTISQRDVEVSRDQRNVVVRRHVLRRLLNIKCEYLIVISPLERASSGNNYGRFGSLADVSRKHAFPIRTASQVILPETSEPRKDQFRR